jgi:hypothetical protein
MLNCLRCSLLITALGASAPLVFQTEIQAGNQHCCCRVCRQPCGRCCCPSPAPAVQVIPQTTYQPVVETQYAQQPVLQQRDVIATEYRTEPVLETVPATVVENVVVDEGSYQTVWVPRLTTKAVARTTYQSRTAYRTVPYQVTRRVAEYATQTVPYQSVRYVPTTGSALAYTPTPGYTTAVLPPVYGGTTIASTPIFPTPIASASPGATTGLVPPARYADTPSTPISPRSASNADRFSDSRSSLFVPAPSAAQVWQTPRSSVIR